MTKAIKRELGFSMLELLAVMSIAALLTTVAVTSYFSAVRGMGRRSAIKHLANTLTVARQRACMDNARVSVVLFNEVSGVDEDSNKLLVTPSYVICKEMGRITYARGDALVDEFSALDAIFGLQAKAGDPNDYRDFSGKAGGIKLYNLTEGGYCYVFSLVEKYPLASESVYIKKPNEYHIDEGAPVSRDLDLFTFKVNASAGQSTANWKIGDSYGIEASPVQNLPRGFQFGGMNDNQSAFEYITFLPSGRAEFSSGSIRIEELRPPNRSVTMRVDSSGNISYNDDW